MIIEHLWNKLSKSRSGRFLAAFIIGGGFGFSAGASLSHELLTLAIATAGGSVIALVAVGILESIDAERAGTPPQRRPIPSRQIPPKIEAKPPPLPPRPSSPIPPASLES